MNHSDTRSAGKKFHANDASPISGHPENMKHSDARSADKKFHANSWRSAAVLLTLGALGLTAGTAMASAEAATAATAATASDTEALNLLQKVATAAQKLTYSGVFVYQSGKRNETSHIAHLFDGKNEIERLQVLDGSPREVIRKNQEVSCYLPEQKLRIVEKRGSQRQFFPLNLPDGLTKLSDHYAIRSGPAGRVAGVDSQSIILEPRDKNRFAHQLWVEPKSGLLLKASMLDEKDQPLETFAFTQVRLGGLSAKDLLKPPAQVAPADWQVQSVEAKESTAEEESLWQFNHALPGFHRTAGMKRQLRANGPESLQLIFSDGLASISVFIEPASAEAKPQSNGAVNLGPVNVFKRQTPHHLLVVMGDVPADALQRFAEGIELRSENSHKAKTP